MLIQLYPNYLIYKFITKKLLTKAPPLLIRGGGYLSSAQVTYLNKALKVI